MLNDFLIQKKSPRFSSSIPGCTATHSTASTTSDLAPTQAVVPLDSPPSLDGILFVLRDF